MSHTFRHYGGLPAEFVYEVGALVIAAAALEEVIYILAEELAVEPTKGRGSVRGLQAREAANEVISRVKTAGLPPWAGSDIDGAQIETFATAAKGALGERAQIVHSWGALKQIDDAGTMVPFRREQKERGKATSTDATRVRALRRRIEKISTEGQHIIIGVMPEVSPGVYVSFCGGRGLSFEYDPETGWPSIGPRDKMDERAARVADFWKAFMDSGGGRVERVGSPAGVRDVPPWFYEELQTSARFIDGTSPNPATVLTAVDGERDSDG